MEGAFYVLYEINEKGGSVWCCWIDLDCGALLVLL
jgi:hypothetical protein